MAKTRTSAYLLCARIDDIARIVHVGEESVWHTLFSTVSFTIPDATPSDHDRT